MIIWLPGTQPDLGEQLVNVLADLDKEKFNWMFSDLLMRPKRGPKSANRDSEQ
jgi:hypothetical protein